MTEPAISEAEINDLFAKLDALDLSDAQRTLLTAMRQVAWEVTELGEPAFGEEFEESFTAAQAGRVIAYATNLMPHASGTTMIVRGGGVYHHLIGSAATPPMIVRSGHFHTATASGKEEHE
jgi:hypothetical protein